jgi:hypothetical protein
MSQEEVKEYFDFERKKHFDFFLPYYQEKNWQVMRDNINGNYKIDWDVELEVFVGQCLKIDEKARIGDYGDCLVEIIQDMKTGKLGWLFGDKDYIFYGSWDNPEDTYPSSLYSIKSSLLKKYICELSGNPMIRISKKGWGNTWNIVLDWDNLIKKGIVKKLEIN